MGLFALIWIGLTVYLLAKDKPREAGIVFGGGILLVFILRGANFA